MTTTPAPLSNSLPVLSGSPSIGLALGAGGARGLTHALVIEALDEMGLKPQAIAGSSIGAIIGWGAASGLSGKDIQEMAREIFADRYSVAQRFWSMRSKDGGGLFAGISPGQIDAERVVEAFLPHTLTKQFQDLSIPLCIAVTDYYAWKSICIREGSVAPAVAASFAIPMLFQPVVKDGRVLVDGGVADPLPVGMLPDVDIILAVDVIGGPAGDDGQVPTMREALFGSTQILMQTISQEKLQRFPAAVVIRPNIHGFRVLDFLKTHEIFDACEDTKDQVKRKLDGAISTFKK